MGPLVCIGDLANLVSQTLEPHPITPGIAYIFASNILQHIGDISSFCYKTIAIYMNSSLRSTTFFVVVTKLR